MYKDTLSKPSEKGASITLSQESSLIKSIAVYAKNRYQNVSQMINGLYGIRGARGSTLPLTYPSQSKEREKLSDNAKSGEQIALNKPSTNDMVLEEPPPPPSKELPKTTSSPRKRNIMWLFRKRK